MTAPVTTQELRAHLKATLQFVKHFGLRDDEALKIVHEHVYGETKKP